MNQVQSRDLANRPTAFTDDNFRDEAKEGIRYALQIVHGNYDADCGAKYPWQVGYEEVFKWLTKKMKPLGAVRDDVKRNQYRLHFKDRYDKPMWLYVLKGEKTKTGYKVHPRGPWTKKLINIGQVCLFPEMLVPPDSQYLWVIMDLDFLSQDLKLTLHLIRPVKVDMGDTGRVTLDERELYSGPLYDVLEAGITKPDHVEADVEISEKIPEEQHHGEQIEEYSAV
jgi:hypothetical protein